MSYRSDDRARSDRRDALERTLGQLDVELRDLQPLRQERDAVRGQLEALRQDEAAARRRALLPVLRRVTVSSPCREKWDKMKGDDRVRFCGRCDKNVYNLSAMEPQEANALLDSQANMCVRFLRRRDGTIVSGECAGGIARRKWTGRLLGVAGLALIAGAGFGAAAMGGEVVGKAPAEHDDVEEVAGGVSSYDDGEGRPYDLPEGSDYGEPNYGNVGNVGGAPIGGFNSGNRNR